MSCNGCRVLRKGCGDSCILRPCLSWIDGANAQAHATIFVAKFFGRAGLLSFISAVPEPQRPALFQSLLFEACGRTVSPVHGAVGLLWSGNWRICQAAVETVLCGGTISVIPELLVNTAFPPISTNESSEGAADDGSCTFDMRNNNLPISWCEVNPPRFSAPRCSKRMKPGGGECPVNLGLSLKTFSKDEAEGAGKKVDSRRPGTPSMNSEEESVTTTTTCFESGSASGRGNYCLGGQPKRLLNLFN